MKPGDLSSIQELIDYVEALGFKRLETQMPVWTYHEGEATISLESADSGDDDYRARLDMHIQSPEHNPNFVDLDAIKDFIWVVNASSVINEYCPKLINAVNKRATFTDLVGESQAVDIICQQP